jgi:hypothetical protein
MLGLKKQEHATKEKGLREGEVLEFVIPSLSLVTVQHLLSRTAGKSTFAFTSRSSFYATAA